VRARVGNVAGEVGLLLLALVFLAPLLVGINLALRAPGLTTSYDALTTHPVLSEFTAAWRQAGMGSAILTSLLITGSSVLGVLVFAGLGAYPLARSTARWSKVTFGAFATGLLLPFQLALVPLFETMRSAHLLGTPWSVVIYEIAVNLPAAVFILTGFLRGVPVEYEEAAALDGAGPFGTWWRVLVPLMLPAFGTVAIIVAVIVWNDFLTPLLFLSGAASQTAPLAVYTFAGQLAQNYPLIFASLFIAISPLLIFFVVMQRHVIRGFAGGLKG